MFMSPYLKKIPFDLTPVGPKARECIHLLAAMQEWFHRSMQCFREEHSQFAPNPDMFTVAQHIQHTAGSVIIPLLAYGKVETWNDRGDAVSIECELKRFDDGIFKAMQIFAPLTDAEILTPFPKEPPYKPTSTLFDLLLASMDHTAHHRGALTAYARILGLDPRLPYFDTEDLEVGRRAAS